MTTVSRPVSFRLAASSTESHIGTTGVATFVYETDRPFEVKVEFTEGDGEPWFFGRDILADGLTNLSGRGDVRCWAEGLWYFVLLTSPDGYVGLRMLAEPVRAFLVDAEDLVPYGSEVIDFDAELARLIATGGAR